MKATKDYHATLARAIKRLEYDSFEARGAVYDRAWQYALGQFRASQYSDEAIAKERSDFLGAVQSIEFGVSVARSSIASAGLGSSDNSLPAAQRKAEKKQLGRRPVFWRVAARLASAVVVLGIGGLAYIVMSDRQDPSSVLNRINGTSLVAWPAQFVSAFLTSARTERDAVKIVQRAVLYEESLLNPVGTAHVGRAVWRTHAPAISPKNKAKLLLSIDVEIPEHGLVLKISAQREVDGAAVISHVVEFRFSGSGKVSSGTVENVLGILMKDDELSQGIELTGKIIKVQPGIFLMGLSGQEADVRRNIALLKTRQWLDIPIVLRDGSRSILAIEKGLSGQAALDEVIGEWPKS